ncbi:MAG TPA: cyclic nucleotide-binding domain-containing protein [Thermoanaerobaculia bacterium]
MLRDFLRNVSLFKDLEDEQLRRMEAALRQESLPAKQVIFREGDPVDAFYLVKEGLVTVFREEKGKPLQVLARLEPGGFFGEMGLLNDKARRVASARTALPTVLLRMEKPDLIALLADNPILELKFRAEVIRRHGMNISALLGLAGQRDVRIHLSADAVMTLEDGAEMDVRLENLSLGGVGLSGVPDTWQIKDPVCFNLGRKGEPPILKVNGVVTWREGGSVGVAFDGETAGNAPLIQRVLRTFLDSRK